MCTGRVDLSFPLRAFLQGADGVFIGGCWPGECHYITEGNYDALGNVLLGRRMMQAVGLDPARLRLEWVAASEGSRYAEIMDDFVQQLQAMGPLGESEGIEPPVLRRRLETVNSLVPWVKLVERERLRVPQRSEQAYRETFASAEVDRLFDELIADKLAVGQIVSLLGERPRTTGELTEALGMDPSEVMRHTKASSQQGLVRFDMERGCYALT